MEPWVYLAGSGGVVRHSRPWLAYKLGKRQSSGQIETSEARDLWQAVSLHSQLLREDITRVRDELARVEQEFEGCKKKLKAQEGKS